MNISSGKIFKPRKVVLYGPEGIGKSTFASHFPDALFIDTEGSTHDLDVRRFDRPTSWEMLLSQVRYVEANPDICQTLVIDTIDWAEHLCADALISRNQWNSIESPGYGKGYQMLMEDFRPLLTLLDRVNAKGVNILLTAHAQLRKIDLPEEMGSYDHWEMKTTKKNAPLIREWATEVFFANYKTMVIEVEKKKKAQGGKRVIYTNHTPFWDAKNRLGLPDELDLDYSEIAHHFAMVQPTEVQPAAVPEPELVGINLKVDERIPKALRDLMLSNGVDEWEIQNVVFEKGYYPSDVPVCNYDRSFIDGCLVGAWPQVFEAIKTYRNQIDVPFR